MNAAHLTATGVGVAIEGRPIVQQVDLDAEPGCTVGIIGPNGSGKSTLLRVLAGLTTPTTGRVRLDGRTVGGGGGLGRRDVARRLAYVEQSADTDVDLRVEEVVALGRLPFRPRMAGPTADDTDRCSAALAQVGLAGFEHRRWRSLSGGERQRVQLARAFAQDPAAILLDEPTNHLDLHHRFLLMDLLRECGATVVIVLHELDAAARHCDDLVLLDGGRVVGAGSPGDVLTAESIERVFRVRAEVDRRPDGLALRFLGRSGA
ncbi:ABC transporter ATP-binding protein [Plantibacter sp. Mn2098]|uniref:ABC transporter ATP-binding protein n=1 Tax=Plantibacter sp. Mn2098 TaxID=3395266 RepID=UPI003BE15926